MNYQPTAVPITTVEEYDAAVAANASIQFTAGKYDRVDAPRFGFGSCGWIVPFGLNDRTVRAYLTGGQLRAFYPIQNHEAYMAAARTLRDEE